MNSTYSRVARLLARPASERHLLLCGMALPPLLWLSLRIAGFARTLAWLDQVKPAAQHAADPVPGERIATLLRNGSSHSPFGANCLTLALITRFFLLRRGHECHLRIGVRREGAGTLEAHAWVQLGGVSCDDASPSGPPFLPFDEPIDELTRQGVWRTSP